jgi:hypothetical protein
LPTASDFVQNQGANTQTASFNISGNGYVAGRVGVGTTSPITQLANSATNIVSPDGNGVSSQALNWVSSTGGFAAAIANTAASGTNSGLEVKVSTASGTALDVSRGAALGTAGTALFTVRNNGNVGINNLLPSATLHVAGSSSTVRLEGLGDGSSTRIVTAAADGTLSAQALPVDTDAQQLSLSGSTLSLSNGGSVTLPDANATNELQTLSLNGSTISLSNGGGSVTVPSAADNLGNHTATQNLNMGGFALTGTGASISGVGVGVRADGGLNLGQNTAGNNLLLGYQAGANLISNQGIFNQFFGYQAGLATTTGVYDTFEGYKSGASNTTGNYNTFVGSHTGYLNSSGEENVFIGTQAGASNTIGDDNTFTGEQSGYSNAGGSYNSFYGMQSGLANTSGNGNSALGYHAGPSAAGLTNATAIGYNAKVSQSNSLVLGGTGTDALSVGIGTTAPARTLDVNGTIRQTTYSSGATLLTVAASGTGSYTWTHNLGYQPTLMITIDQTGGGGGEFISFSYEHLSNNQTRIYYRNAGSAASFRFRWIRVD